MSADFRINVLMFGQTGAGKTSLLACILNAFQVLPQFENLIVASDQSHELDATLSNLKKYIRTLDAGEPVGIPPTASRKQYTIDVQVTGFGHRLKITITDMPGEWLELPDKKDEWISLIRGADIVMNVISAPAMMEKNREYNEDINKPSRFKEYLGKALEDAKQVGAKHILFVPVKVEKYLRDLKNLDNELRKAYGNHITVIRNTKHHAAWIPVSTLGSVHFREFELVKGMPIERYVVTGAPNWSPKNHDHLGAKILHICLRRLVFSFPQITTQLGKSEVDLVASANGVTYIYEHPTHYVNPFAVPNGGCFAGDTPVRLGDGKTVCISEIRVGDRVLSYCSESRALCVHDVITVNRRSAGRTVTVSFDGASVNVTLDHQLLTPVGWKRVGELMPGMQVLAMNKEKGDVVATKVLSISSAEIISDVYNLIVAGTGTFTADGIVASSYSRLAGVRRYIQRHIFSPFRGNQHEQLR